MNDLIDDIRRAREELRKRELETSQAGYTLKMARATAEKARHALDELLDELETGRSRYPIFERITRSNGTADEHQRGPTTFPESSTTTTPAEGQVGNKKSRTRKKPAAGPRFSQPNPTAGGQVQDT
jgi:hypothetical protein